VATWRPKGEKEGKGESDKRGNDDGQSGQEVGGRFATRVREHDDVGISDDTHAEGALIAFK
jgi:hypothetical protein